MARILLVFRPRTGGTFGHVRVLATELAARGHEVAVCGPEGRAGDDLGAPLYQAAIPREVAPLASIRAVTEVARAYRRFRPDLIHAHGAQAGVVARLARPARPRTPLVHTPHRYAFIDGARRTPGNLAAEVVERGLMPATTRVLCVCEAERAIAERIGARDRARVVHNGVPPFTAGRLDPALAEFAAGGPLIVAVSELFRRKGVEVLMEALSIVLGSHPEARLIVAGDGPDRPSVETARDRFGLGGRVLLAGQLDGVAGLLGAADVFVNPALAEGLPYGVLEAMSAGCPCVVTDAGGTAEAVVDGESGLVVPIRDAAALAGGITRMLGDRGLAAACGDAARSRVSSRFSRRQMIEGTLGVYADLGV